ncbi:hypothetical protein C1645_836628 [Glomus cerebriforme]|uniref:HCP-like protein n=1 Tax=Glomus cerebriforme TaxID=658196 RepID=A0A397SCB7_9GLOM|nr:hypothetical protein C1645_836628 [Glomus cerebriforme]
MSDNLNNNNKKNYDNTHNSESINLENSNFLPDLDTINHESFTFKSTSPSLITKFFKELLEELYILLLDMDISSEIYLLDELIANYLVDYDLDPKNVLEIMINSSQNIICYSSLIGYFYQRGIGCEVNEANAFEIFFNAIKYDQKVESDQFSFDEDIPDDIKKLNKIILQYFYSLLLYKDIILIRSVEYKLHIKNAEKGDPTSQYYIGNCYYNGTNIQDYNMASEWYSKSSEGGNTRAMYMLGECKYGVDNKKSFEFYLKSAEGGHKYALSMVGNCYYYGEIGILKDAVKAFEFYLRAAKKGNACCQYLVANYYNDGKYFPKNIEKWFYWNRKAAMHGHITAQYKLADYYLNNSSNKNESKSFKWYLKLANEDRLRAFYLVAKCYRDGIGTDKNLMESIKWIEKYILSDSYGKIQISLVGFLNGSDINVSQVPEFLF